MAAKDWPRRGTDSRRVAMVAASFLVGWGAMFVALLLLRRGMIGANWSLDIRRELFSVGLLVLELATLYAITCYYQARLRLKRNYVKAFSGIATGSREAEI
jgi:hypothetical protein